MTGISHVNPSRIRMHDLQLWIARLHLSLQLAALSSIYPFAPLQAFKGGYLSLRHGILPLLV
jgi:hypothetical protein